jgi:NitT/TauT family transport system substrate-binding protein
MHLALRTFLAVALAGFAIPLLAQQKVVIGLPVSNYGPVVPVYAAQELGLYAKNGVTVEITAFRGGGAMQEALAAGAVDLIENSPVGAAVAIKRGVKQKIVAAHVNAPMGWHIMVLPDSPIKSAKDLQGKNVAITSANGLTDYYVAWAAKRAGVTQYKAIPVGGGGLIPSLKGKQVDAAAMFSPLPYEMMLTNTGRSLVDFGKEMEPNLPDVWVAKQDLIDRNPRALEAVLRSIYQAVVYMKILEYEHDVVLSGVVTSARIEPKWLQFAFDLAKPSGIELPPVSEVYTDKFSAVSAQ